MNCDEQTNEKNRSMTFTVSFNQRNRERDREPERVYYGRRFNLFFHMPKTPFYAIVLCTEIMVSITHLIVFG